MWTDTYSAVCRRHPEVVAAFESPRGRIALLLRPTLTPTPQEMARCRKATTIGARTVTERLRAVGLTSEVTILQWCSPRRIADIVAHWDCTYEGDEQRYAQLIASLGAETGAPSPVNAQ